MRSDNLLFLSVFLPMILGGCASGPARVIVLQEPTEQVSAPVIVPSDQASDVALQALAYLGTPYQAGGLSPQTGFDCSGLVAYAYRQGAGLALPRNTYELSQIGKPIEGEALKPGDLVFYNTQQRDYSHVGIYLGEGRFIHAPSSGGAVRVESLSANYWARRYNGARRIISTSG